MRKTTFAVTGDAFMTRRLPKDGNDGLEEIQEVLGRNDVCFSNLEMTVHNQEGYPAAFSGGTWAMSDPGVLDDLKRYGFNLFNTANNHTGDFGHGGMLATIRHLRERGMLFAGTGENLAEASAPVYVETRGARVAMVAACSSYHDSDMAGNQSLAMKGRPGLNPLRFTKTFHVEQPYFDMLSEVAEKTKMNAALKIDIANGYRQPLPEGVLNFGGMNFRLDSENGMTTEPLKKDMDRILASVREAKRQADYALVSIHTHAFKGESLEEPPDYLVTFAHACIDEGADAVIGHGVHVLRGIEIYKGRIIFYGLGNFIFQTETVALQPAEAYENAGMPYDTEVGEYMSVRSKNGTRGYAVQEDVWRSVIAEFTAEDGQMKEIRLHPVSLGMGEARSRLGIPRLSHDTATLEHLAAVSKPYGTEIQIENGVGVITL